MKTTPLLLVVALSVPAFADPPAGGAAPAGPPKPTEELKALGKWLIGNYKCAADWKASPMGPAHKAKGAAVVKWGLGGMWLNSTYKETKTKDNPMPWDVMEMFSHDGKMFWRVGFDSMGGLSITSAPAMTDDKLDLEGDLSGPGMPKTPVKVTFAKSGAKDVKYGFMMKGQDGVWMDLGGGLCKK